VGISPLQRSLLGWRVPVLLWEARRGLEPVRRAADARGSGEWGLNPVAQRGLEQRCCEGTPCHRETRRDAGFQHTGNRSLCSLRVIWP